LETISFSDFAPSFLNIPKFDDQYYERKLFYTYDGNQRDESNRACSRTWARAVARRGFTPRGADDTCRPLATANFRTV